jgi:hypothetical protein
MRTLNAERIQEIVMDCLFRDTEVVKDPVVVEGVMNTFAFHPGRLDGHKAEIVEYLSQLPEAFHVGSGDGSSFLGACVDREDNQWGEHRDIEQLLALGIGVKRARILLPRSLWAMFPGGMPYFAVSDVDYAEKETVDAAQ